MKKIVEKIAALVLAVCIACQFQVPTLAASDTQKYVSEVIVSYGEGDSAEADAKAWLTDNGYEIVDTNLNNGAESSASSDLISWATGARSARAVYLGYKTTTDASQAITSLKAMNMTGNYSFDSYQEVLDKLADEIKAFMADFEITIQEWRENYKAGKGRAIEAYYLLNLMYSPDNNNAKMGDLLLNETKEEMGDAAYNKLSDEEKLQHVDMTTILMEGNSDATRYIEQILAMGADTDSEKTWIDRLAESGTYDDMMDALEEEADTKGETFLPSEAAAELSTKYDGTAEILAASIANLQTYFKEYLESGTSLQDGESKIEKYVDKTGDNLDGFSWLNLGVIYESLAAVKYPSPDNPDRTLQDFIMQEFDSSNPESREELYPMAAALSDGQRAAISFIPLSQLIAQGILTDEEALANAEEFKAYVDETDPVSVFAGVDRSIYDASSTALTSSARELQNSSQTSYTEGIFGSPFSIQTTVAAAAFTLSLAGMIGSAVTASVLSTQQGAKVAYERLVEKTARNVSMLYNQSQEATLKYSEKCVKKMFEQIATNGPDAAGSREFIRGNESAIYYINNAENWKDKVTLIKGFKIATGVLVVATIALGVWTVISGINDLKAYYNRDMDLYPIPANMVDESEDADGKQVYTYYKAVQSNRTEKGLTEDREALADNADLNGDLGKEWLALYYTKDSSAGNPIVVSDISGFTVIKGQESTPENMVALTLFGNESPVNLTNEEWVWNDVNGGLYLYYTVGTSASNAASVFTGSGKWAVYLGAGVIIALIFFFGGFGISRKRKNSESAEA